MQTGRRDWFRLATLAVIAVYALWAFPAHAAVEAQPDAGAPAPRWTVAPEAQRILDEMRKSAKAYRPRSDHIGIFARAQLKYGAQRTDFIHRWYDRPLHQDSTLADTMDERRLLHPEAWKKTAEAVRMGKMDGLAFCATLLGRSVETIPLTARPDGEMKLLMELPYVSYESDSNRYFRTAELALATPNAYRIDGKVVLTRYPPVMDDQLDWTEKVRRAFDERFGPGKFIVMVYVSVFDRVFRGVGTLTPGKLEWGREHLRRCLRKMDGIFLDGWEVYGSRRYDVVLEREVLVPLCQSVLAEPEFAGRKCLGVGMMLGHENCYRWNYDIDSQGTRTLVARMDAMRALRPDFMICCEWDEENENTCFRPMVANGFVHQRILRYFADLFAGRAPQPLPGDDTTIPNLVVSYRRSIVAGEPIEAEVRNIPDGTFAGQTFACSFAWKGLDGRTVKSYPPADIAADTAGNAFFSSPASELVAANRVLVPELRVRTSDGREFAFGGDFWPMDLNAVRALDAKWAKHALRERAPGVTGSIAASEPGEDGTVEVKGRFAAPSPVRSVEVLEGPDTVFMYDPSSAPRTDRVVLKISFQARATAPKSYALTGDVRIENAPGLELISKPSRSRTALADGWRLRNGTYSNWDYSLFAAIPNEAVDKAEIVVSLPPAFPSTRIRVREVVEKDIVGVGGPAGGNLVVRRYLSQIAIPRPCNADKGEFSFRMKPLGRSDVLRLQIVDADRNVWRGSPVVLERPTGRTCDFHVFERDDGRVTKVSVDSCRAEMPEYRFEPTRGSIVWTDSGRHLSGILGGVATLVTGMGQGESNYGDTLARYLPAEPLDNAPRPAAGPGGAHALAFDGGDYAMLPQQLVSRFAGFEVGLDVCPDSLEGVQPLVDAGNAAYGVFLRDGTPEARFWAMKAKVKGPRRLRVGEWSNVRLVFDQSSMTMFVDGVPGVSVPFSGCQYQSRYTAIGGENKGRNFFRGRMANLRFSLR